MNIESLKIRARQSRVVRAALAPAILTRRYFWRRQASTQNALLQNLVRLLADDPVVRVAEFSGDFCISARSDIFRRLAIHGEYEPTLVARCLERIDPDRDFLDVGANVGFYSVLMAKTLRGGRVLAVEPTRAASARLRHNLQRNGVAERVTVLQAAIALEKGEIELRTIQGMEEFSSLGAMNHPSIAAERVVVEKVACTTVDAAVADHGLRPGFMKVDVEGMEHVVFGGASILLTQHRPVILSELSDYLLRRNGSSSADVIALLRRYNYRVVDAADPTVPVGIRDFGDVLCIPD